MTEQEKIQEVNNEMLELGYDCDESLVLEVLNYHRRNPLKNNAALAANILAHLSEKGVDIVG